MIKSGACSHSATSGTAEPAPEEPLNPLAPGTRVGAWRVKAWQGQGVYGAVYRVERVGWRRAEPGALKVSVLLWNWRMEREVELLSRLSHPGIPRLLDHRWPPGRRGRPGSRPLLP